MTLGAIIVCRLDSRRLPGKVLKTVQGKPLLWYVLSRCRKVQEFGDNIIVATSTRTIDDPIEHYCREQNVRMFRGSAENVAERVLECALDNRLSHFARVNADSPFLEPPLIKLACSIAASSEDYEIVTNLYPRSFPYGVSVELFKTDVFQSAYKQMNTPDHFEHVTLFFYENMHNFRYYNITRDGNDLSKIRLTVDTEEDFRLFSQVMNMVGDQWNSLSYVDAVEFYQKLRAQK